MATSPTDRQVLEIMDKLNNRPRGTVTLNNVLLDSQSGSHSTTGRLPEEEYFGKPR